MIKNAFLNRFTLQVVISTIPAVLVLANWPHLIRQAGLPVYLIALLFFLARLGAIAGAQSGPWILKQMPPHLVSAGAEAINAIFGMGVYFGIQSAMPAVISLSVFLKGFSTGGLLPNFRVAWLKALPVPEAGRRIMIIAQVITQSSYGLIGLLLIAGIAQKIALGLVLLDVVTSLIAVPVFLSLKDIGIGTIANKSSERLAFRFLFAKPNLPLLASDLSLAVAIGGTNIFLLRAGEGLFQNIGGYGFALLVYAAAYLLGGVLVQSHHGTLLAVRKRAELLAPLTLLSSLLLLIAPTILPSQQPAAFFVLFLSYPVYLLTIESRWFVASSESNIGRTFATRFLLMSLIWALGELFYSRMALAEDISIRLIAAFFSALVFFKFNRPTHLANANTQNSIIAAADDRQILEPQGSLIK